MGIMLEDSETFLNVVVYGKSGSGKTTLGVTAPKPFFLLSERQGFRAVAMAASRLGVQRPPVLYLEHADDLRAAMRVLRTGGSDVIPRVMLEVLGDTPEVRAAISRLPYTEPQTIVGDSFTDMCRLVSEDIMGSIKATAADGQETKNDRYWDLMRGRAEKLMVALRDLPYHVLLLCLVDDRMVGEKGEERSRQVSPDTPMRALPGRLLAATNACGLAFVRSTPRQADNGDTEYDQTWAVRFRGPNFLMLKGIEPLVDVEEPNFSDWIMRVLAHDAALAASSQQQQPAEPEPEDKPRNGEKRGRAREAEARS